MTCNPPLYPEVGAGFTFQADGYWTKAAVWVNPDPVPDHYSISVYDSTLNYWVVQNYVAPLPSSATPGGLSTLPLVGLEPGSHILWYVMSICGSDQSVAAQGSDFWTPAIELAIPAGNTPQLQQDGRYYYLNVAVTWLQQAPDYYLVSVTDITSGTSIVSGFPISITGAQTNFPLNGLPPGAQIGWSVTPVYAGIVGQAYQGPSFSVPGAVQPPPSSISPPVINMPTFGGCDSSVLGTDGNPSVPTTFTWANAAAPTAPTITAEWLDLSLQDNGFAAGTFVSIQLNPGDISYQAAAGNTIGPLLQNATHYWRINEYINGAWYPSLTGSFTTPSCVTAPPSSGTYTVQTGDNLSSIAAVYGLTWQQLYCYNISVIGSDPNLILPGEILNIPPASYVATCITAPPPSGGPIVKHAGDTFGASVGFDYSGPDSYQLDVYLYVLPSGTTQPAAVAQDMVTVTASTGHMTAQLAASVPSGLSGNYDGAIYVIDHASGKSLGSLSGSSIWSVS